MTGYTWASAGPGGNGVTPIDQDDVKELWGEIHFPIWRGE